MDFCAYAMRERPHMLLAKNLEQQRIDLLAHLNHGMSAECKLPFSCRELNLEGLPNCRSQQLQWIKSVDIRPTATYNPQQGLRQRKFWTKTPT